MAYSRFDFTQWGTGLDSQGLPRDATKVMDFYRQVAANPSTPYAKGILQGIQAYAKNNPGSTSDPMWVTNALDWYWRDIQRKSQKEHSPLGDFGLPLAIAGTALGGAGALGLLPAGAATTAASVGSKVISGINTAAGAASKFLGSGVGSTLLKAAPQLIGAALSYFGGDDDPYEKQLLASRNAEAQRQAARNANAGVVNSTLNNQDDYYKRLRSSVFDYQKNALDTRKTDEERELKFELARRGHLGGSQEVDAIGDLTRLYQRGLLDAGTLADNTVSSVRTNDQAVKQQALASVLNDADANQAIQNAVNQSNLGSAQALDTAKGQNLGDVFTGLSYLYQQGQQQKERQRATVDYYGRRGGSGVGPASSYSGSVNRKVA